MDVSLCLAGERTKAVSGSRSHRPGRRSAFTLIELLIVVAIIAILAAIAVPNFMEAQTRAKVARVKTDMRSLAVAIEAYKTDTNSYPLDWMELTRRLWPARAPMDADEALFVLTTPIAYISSVPTDPFATQGAIAFPWRSFNKRYCYSSRGGYSLNRFGKWFYPGCYFYPPHDHYRYLLVSPGPDLWLEFMRDEPIGEISPLPYSGNTLYYDPTNGSMSQGDIIMYGPGNAFNPPPPTDYPNGEWIIDWFKALEPGYPV